MPDLVRFVQSRKHEKHPWRSVTFSEVAGFQSPLVTLLHGCFSCFLDCTNRVDISLEYENIERKGPPLNKELTKNFRNLIWNNPKLVNLWLKDTSLHQNRKSLTKQESLFYTKAGVASKEEGAGRMVNHICHTNKTSQSIVSTRTLLYWIRHVNFYIK